jgi:hypothetical protein
MNIRNLAMALAIAFLGVGVLGFLPPLVSPPSGNPDLAVDQGYGLLLGLFPINVLHNLIHLVFGLAGLAMARTYDGARAFGRAVAIIYALLTVMGLVPGLNTTFGLVPIFGHDVWLHALLALLGAYIGWMAPTDADVRDRVTADRA